PSLVRFSEKAPWAEDLFIALSKATTTSAFGRTSVASSAGRTKPMVGGFVVVNCHVFATASGFPARSSAAVETLAVNCVPTARSASGLKRSTPGPYQPKLPLTGAPSLVRSSEKAPWAEDLFMALSKATMITAFRCTSVASSAGRTKLTVGLAVTLWGALVWESLPPRLVAVTRQV